MNDLCLSKPVRTAAPSPWEFHPPAFRAGRSIEISLCPVRVVAESGCKADLTAGGSRSPAGAGSWRTAVRARRTRNVHRVRIFNFQGSRELFSLIHWTFFRIF